MWPGEGEGRMSQPLTAKAMLMLEGVAGCQRTELEGGESEVTWRGEATWISRLLSTAESVCPFCLYRICSGACTCVCVRVCACMYVCE